MKKATLFALVLLFVTACSSSNENSTDRTESLIRNGVKNQLGIDVTVKCPGEVEPKPGRTFHCVVEDPSTGERRLAVVTVENKEGYVTWRLQ